MEWLKGVKTEDLRILEIALLESRYVFVSRSSDDSARSEYFKLRDNIHKELKNRC